MCDKGTKDDLSTNWLHGKTIAYHWSPQSRRASIEGSGLVIGSDPSVNGVEDDFRSPWVSLSPTPALAWWLSVGALEVGGFVPDDTVWLLWEVDITGLAVQGDIGRYPEYQVLQNISAARLMLVGQRNFEPCAS